jgi:hypothetical protein
MPEMEAKYPDAAMFGDLPAYGLYCRHVAGLTADGLDLGVAQPDARPAVVLDDARGVHVRSLRAMPPAGGGPTLWMHGVQDVDVTDTRRHAGGNPVVRVGGRTTSRVRLLSDGEDGRDLHAVVLDGDVVASALTIGRR